MANIFSIDISEQFIRVADLELKKDKIELFSLGYDSAAPDFYTNLTEKSSLDQSKIISQIVGQLNITASKANVVIPDAFAYSQLLLMPDLPEEEIVKSIRIQADEFVPLPIDDVYIDLEVITKLKNGKLLIIFVASQKKIVDHIYNTLELANIEGVSLENDLSAVGRFFTEVFTFIKEPSLVVNFGYSGSTFGIVNPPFPFYQVTRSSRIGFDIILRDLIANSSMDKSQAIEALKTIGLGKDGSVNIYAIIFPVLSEFYSEIEKTILLAKQKYNINIKNIYLYNIWGVGK